MYLHNSCSSNAYKVILANSTERLASILRAGNKLTEEDYYAAVGFALSLIAPIHELPGVQLSLPLAS